MKPVHNTHRGLNTQNKVTLLIFLQLLKDPNFDHVVFEDANWEDATFHFKDGKRVFLEVKDYQSRPISLAFAKREVLSKFRSKLNSFNKEDKILIAGLHIKDEIESYAKSLEYMSDRVVPDLKKRGFSKVEIELLKRVSTFEYNEWLDENVGAYLTAALRFWLPPSELIQFKDNLLQAVVSTRSSKGASLSIEEFNELAEAERKTLQVGMYDEVSVPTDARIQEIFSILTDDLQRFKNIDNPRVLSSLMSNPSNVSLLLIALENKMSAGDPVDFNSWNSLFQAAIHPAYSFRLIHVFDISLSVDSTNADFFLDFWIANITKFLPPVQDGYLVGELMKLTTKVINADPSLHARAFDLVKETNRILNRGKFSDKNHLIDSHDLLQLGQLTLTIFNLSSEAEKIEILEWIHANFCLNRDEGEFLFSTPSSIYQIWLSYIKEKDSLNRLDGFIEIVDEDYLSDPMLTATRGKLKGQSLYQGYDHIGGGIGQNGDEYKLIDRAYIEAVLKPVFDTFYQDNPKGLWELLPRYITTKESEVGVFKAGKAPDYLSRALIPIIIRLYLGDDANKSASAFTWLCKFIRFRKGIPSRTDIIFQELFNRAPSDPKSWQLVRYQLNLAVYKKTPANIFVEKIMQALLEAGVVAPLPYVSSLLDNELYLKYRGVHDFYLTRLTQALISQKETQKEGSSLLERMLKSTFFNETLSDFEVYDIKGPIQALFDADPSAGNNLLKEIISNKDSLTKHRQIALTCYLRDMSDETAFLSNVYETVFKDVIDRASKKELILSSYLDYVHTREEIAEFAGKLCKAKLIDEGLTILELLVNDPSPSADDYADDMQKPHEVHAIQSVKGHVAWSVQNIVSLEGRPCLTRAFALVKILATDPNIYIRSQACFPLTSFIRARHWYMSDNETERYMADVNLVHSIDDLTISMVESTDCQKYPGLTKAVVHAISYLRSIDSTTAKQITAAVLQTNENGIMDFLPTLFFFAEFRQDSFIDWGWNKDFPLGKFSPTYFRNTIKNLCEKGSAGVKGSIAWTLWSMYKKEGVETTKAFEIIDRYIGPLLEAYGKEWYDDMYHLTDDFREAGYTDRAITLWELCLTNERKALDSSPQQSGGHTVGRYHDSEMLFAILNSDGDAEFQKWLSFILADSDSMYLNDIKGVYEKASEPNKQLLRSLYPHVLIKEFNI